jgi:transposase
MFSGRKHWSLAHLRWLAGQKFEHPAQQIVFQDAVDAIEDAAARLRRLDVQLAAIVPSWSMAPVVYQAMRGVSFIVAVTFVAEIGDVRRFDNPRQVMAFLGLVPAERSTGERVRRAGLTLAGNRRARRVLIEGAWTYRYPARVSETLRARIEGLLKPSVKLPGRLRSVSVRAIAGSAPPERRRLWSSPRSPAKWRRFCGPSVATSNPQSERAPEPDRIRLHSAGDGATEGNSRANYVAGLRPTPAF